MYSAICFINTNSWLRELIKIGNFFKDLSFIKVLLSYLPNPSSILKFLNYLFFETDTKVGLQIIWRTQILLKIMKFSIHNVWWPWGYWKFLSVILVNIFWNTLSVCFSHAENWLFMATPALRVVCSSCVHWLEKPRHIKTEWNTSKDFQRHLMMRFLQGTHSILSF